MTAASFKGKIWQRVDEDPRAAERLAAELAIPRPLAQLLAGRGFVEPEAARRFLSPALDQLPPPERMRGVTRAAAILAEAVCRRHLIVVYGDYDVDGVTATATLIRFLRQVGARCRFVQPLRFAHGYGLHAGLVRDCLAAEKIPGQGRVVVTVDCGISDHQEVAALKADGWRVIITDHHQPPPTVPPADAVVDPWQPDCHFPDKELCGAGVALYLIMALRRALAAKGYWGNQQSPALKPLLDLVAIGTLCDMVGVVGINRVLVRAGLEVMGAHPSPGLAAMMRQAGLEPGQVSGEEITFQIGPRLNAAGRLESAHAATNLLLAGSTAEARDLALNIEEYNNQRRELTNKVSAEALAAAGLALENGQADAPCLVIHGPDWHQGVIGIAASRVVEVYGRPVIVLCGRDHVRGSARSIPGVDILGLIRGAGESLIGYGGHRLAAGLSIYEKNIEKFIALIGRDSQDRPPTPAANRLAIDAVIDPEDKRATLETYARINAHLAPFGPQNPEPVYAAGPLRTRDVRVMGRNGEHLSCKVRLLDGWHRAVGFFMGAAAGKIEAAGGFARITMTIARRHYRGRTTLQVTLQDFIL